MAKLFHIQASPRDSRSASQAVASCFIKSYSATHSGDTVETLDLWKTDLPEINGAMLDAAYAIKHGQAHSPEQMRVWQVIVRIVEHFKSGRQISRLAADVEFQHPLQNRSTTLICSCIEG